MESYLVMVEEGSELGHEQNVQLQEEMAAVAARQREEDMAERDPSRNMPVHSNSFDVLSQVPCESEDVDISGYTGKDEEVSEVDITGVTTEWGEEDDEVESVAHMCSGGERWKESPGKGNRNAWRGDGKEGVLKVQFCDEVKVHEFVPPQTAARDWERSVSYYRPERELERVQRALRGRVRGTTCPGEATVSNDGFILEEISDDELCGNVVPSVVKNVVQGQGKLGSDGEDKVKTPRNFREARQSREWDFWEEAMHEEMTSLQVHETWDYVPRRSWMRVIPSHWVYALKTDSEGNVTRYKARLVADGNRQIMGVDVNDIFAPTASFAARRVLLSVAAARDMEVHQVDIKTAFLNGMLNEDVYMCCNL
jgi:hypothetical protein